MSSKKKESDIPKLLGQKLYKKCQNFVGITPQEISERVQYLRSHGYPQMTPQLLIQDCRLLGEKTKARLDELRRSLPGIVNQLRNGQVDIHVVEQAMKDLIILSKTPYYQSLPPQQKQNLGNIYQDLERFQERYGRQFYVDEDTFGDYKASRL